MPATNETGAITPLAPPRRRSWLWRLAVYGPLAAIIAALLIHPYLRQSIFGPTIEGQPVWYWQQLYRQQHARGEKTAFGLVRRLFGLAAPGDPSRTIPVDDPAMAPALAELLRDSNEHVRQAALRDLSSSRRERLPALREDLIRLLDDPLMNTRVMAAHYLADLKSTRDLPALERLLEDPNPECRMLTALAIHRLDPTSERVLAAVRGGLKEPPAQALAVHAAAVMTGYGDRLYVDLRAYALEDPDLHGLLAMARFGHRAVPDILQFLEGPDVKMRQAAAVALCQMEPPPQEAEPGLLRRLEDVDDRVRVAAWRALERIDPGKHPQPPTVAD